MMKKNRLFAAVFTAFFLCTSVFSYDANVTPVYDQANILSFAEREHLNQKVDSIVAEHDYNMGVYIVIVSDMEDLGCSFVEDGAETWYKNHNLGLGNEKNGILLFISMAERDYDICAYGSNAHRTFTDYGKNRLSKAMLPKLSEDKWCEGFDAYLTEVNRLIGSAENERPVDVDSPGFDSEILVVSFVIAFSLSLIIALCVVFAQKRNMNNIALARNADRYVDENGVKILQRQDRFTHTTVQRIPIQTESKNSGGFNGGTTINSGGFSHSSGKF